MPWSGISAGRDFGGRTGSSFHHGHVPSILRPPNLANTEHFGRRPLVRRDDWLAGRKGAGYVVQDWTVAADPRERGDAPRCWGRSVRPLPCARCHVRSAWRVLSFYPTF